jgi:hypothetical protein
MNIKHGFYALYKGREYEANKPYTPAGQVEMLILISSDRQDMKYGFTEAAPDRYILRVPLNEVQSAYSIYTKAEYKGLPVTISKRIGNNFEIYHTSNGPAAESLGFTKIEPGHYEKKVSVSEVDNIHEVKQSLWGF